MKKLLIVFILITTFTRSEEGMWIPSLLKALNESDMKTMGMKLSAEDLYSINNSSIKDAIVHFNGGCTAEVISKEGLILTNHHCGYSAIQSHSSVEKNYLKNGFWAMSRSEELPNPGMTCTFIVKIEDVTKEVMKALNSSGDISVRAKNITEMEKRIIDRETKNTHYEAVIKPFNYGNAYFVIVTETYKDIRLVGAPPSSIGKFGGDTDNWMWPRHTGDFSLFRIYANEKNEPAEFSETNKPFKPRHSLPVSLEPRTEGEFSMVYGFPGYTEQYLISKEVDYRINKELPRRIDLRESSLDVINNAMRSSESIYIKYASKQARIANAWKKWIGQIGGLKNFNALQKKIALEKEYMKLSMQNEEYKEYRSVIADLEKLYNDFHKVKYARANFTELYYYSGPEILRYCERFMPLMADSLDADDAGELHGEKIIKGVRGFFKDYDPEVDKDVFKNAIRIYLLDNDISYMPAAARDKFRQSPDEYVDYLFEKSFLDDSTQTIRMVKGFSKKWRKKMRKDPLYKLAMSMRDYYINDLRPKNAELATQEYQLMRVFVKGMMEMMPNERYWYDANSTLRVTYGKVEGSAPRDGMEYKYYTTMDGVLAKYDPDNPDFVLPERLIELGKKRDYGQYAQNGELFVCFTGSNHTTGGNSGSPCLNGEGHLIGLNFDRSWESTMSDIMFDPNICRNIMVDVRYVLFIVDKFAGASHLIDEMELVTPEWREKYRAEYLKKMVKQVTDSIQSHPEELRFLILRSKYYDSLGLSKEYHNDLESAYKTDKTNPLVASSYAEMLIKDKNFVKAVTVLTEAIKKNKNQSKLYFERGLAYTELKQYLKGVYDFTKVIEMEPTNYKAYYNRGVCNHLKGRFDQGCSDFEMAQKLGDNREYWIYESVCK